MNDTINLRRDQILTILAKKPSTREEIAVQLPGFSKVTLIRDLNFLEKNNLLAKKGKARAVVYYSKQNLLLRKFDPQIYFAPNSILRHDIKSSFNAEIFNNYQGIFSADEETKLKSGMKNLSAQEKKLDPTIFKREIERFTVEFSWKSSRIEGNTYSLLEAEMLIKQTKQVGGHSQYEAVMILNHKKAIDFILQNRPFFQKLTRDKIIKLHGILIGDLEISTGLRQDPVAITGTNYVPPANQKAINEYLEQVVNLINETELPIAKALFAGVLIPYLQPFVDGNKRTGRTLSNAILIAFDYYPLSYRDIVESDYIKSLLLFYEQNSLFSFRKIFLSQLDFSLNNYFRTND
jgi:Fic family protein